MTINKALDRFGDKWSHMLRNISLNNDVKRPGDNAVEHFAGQM